MGLLVIIDALSKFAIEVKSTSLQLIISIQIHSTPSTTVVTIILNHLTYSAYSNSNSIVSPSTFTSTTTHLQELLN